MPKLVTLVLALGPPGLVSGWLWPEIRERPALFVALLLGYWVLLAVVRFASRVGGTLSDRWVSRLADRIDRSLSTLVGGYRRTYLDLLASSVRDVELVGVATRGEFAIRLEHVYVDVSVARKALYDTAREPFVGAMPTPSTRRALDSFLDHTEPGIFAVLGGPGSGKTTLLRHTALEAGRRPRGRLPVLLYLREHTKAIVDTPEGTLTTLIEAAPWLNGRVPAEWIENRLVRGECLVMLDGLDEVAVADARERVASWVRGQIGRYPRNDYVITSRPHGYVSNPLDNADVLQVRRFTGDQITRFVHNWYYAIECRSQGETGERTRALSAERSEDLLERIRAQPALYDLAANPLLLTMIANVHKYRGALPGSRAALYGEMCDVLLQRRQEEKGIVRPGTGLRSEQKELALRTLALHMMLAGIRDISRASAEDTVAPILERVTDEISAHDFLKDIEQCGLLVEYEVGAFAFAHLTLQEYLAAVEIRETGQIGLLVRHVDDPWWRETTLLAVARSNGTPIIRACLDSDTVQALALAFDCAEEARDYGATERTELQAILHPPGSDRIDPARRRLIAAIRVARELRGVISLRPGADICARPVTTELLGLFLADRGVRGDPRTTRSGDALGITAGEAVQVVDWVNGLGDDGTDYRLPSYEELADPSFRVLSDRVPYTYWCLRDGAPELFCPKGVPDPFLPAGDHLSDVVRDDLMSTHQLMRFGSALSLERDRRRALKGDFARARSRLGVLQRGGAALAEDPTHIDRAVSLARHGNLSPGRELDRALARARGLADGLRDSIGERRILAFKGDDGTVFGDAFRGTHRRVLGGMLDRALANVLEYDTGYALGLVTGLDANDADWQLVTRPTTLRLGLLAHLALFGSWQPEGQRYSPDRAFREYWLHAAGDLVDDPVTGHVILDDIPDSLERIAGDLSSTGQAPSHSWATPYHPGAASRASLEECRDVLLKDAIEVLPQVLEDPARDRFSAACLRLALLAAAHMSTGDARERLRAAVASLTGLQLRVAGRSRPNEALVLVRT